MSIITQSIPGLDNIYGENVRMSLESAAGMKLFLAANDKKTAGEISDGLGKTTKLSVSDSVSRDRDFMQRRSVSRRMEERPLLTPDEVRRLNLDQAILIPERQNPLLVQRIVYFQDPTFKTLFEAQSGPLPYPPKEAAAVQVLTARMEALERRLAERMVVDFVRPEKAKSDAPVGPEPKLAAEIVARQDVSAKAVRAETDAQVQSEGKAVAAREVDLDALKPSVTIAVAKIRSFLRSSQAWNCDTIRDWTRAAVRRFDRPGLGGYGQFPRSQAIGFRENTGPNGPCHAIKGTFSSADEDSPCDPVAPCP